MKKSYENELQRIACAVWDSPEPGFAEFTSSRIQTEFLKEQGFEVKENVCDTITGYTASYGSGHPVIAILGEFDALYGLGQKEDIPEYTPNGKAMGHGCGHHLLGTGAIGAGLLIRDYLKETGKEGTVIVMGCPAEEAGSGKTYMARDGLFDDVDIALTWHPGSRHQVNTGSSQSNINAFFRFHGKAAHAAGDPENGRSALDAVELMDIGANYLREHMPSTDRVHYAITNPGGKSPNVVQAEAEVNYFVRSTTNKGCRELYERVCNLARGAAIMTGTTVDIVFDEGLSNTVPNFVLEDLYDACFREIGVPSYTEEELAYAAAFKKAGASFQQSDIEAYIKDKEKLKQCMREEPLCTYYVENEHSDVCEMGSTDVGDVSWVVPTATINTACWSWGTPGHSWQLTAQGKSSIAMKGMYLAADIMALAAEKIYEDHSIIQKAWNELNKRTQEEAYQCLIPKDIKPHVCGE